MLVATVLALTSAGLHATWNLIAKRSADPFLALWGQFFVAAGIAAVVLGATGGLPAAAWGFAAITGVVHIPYVAGLAASYERGDFSVAYPLARGGGALLAGVGGLVLLADEMSVWSIAAIVTVATGMALLAVGAGRPEVGMALLVAVTIGVYTVVDSHAARELGGNTYAFAAFVAVGVCVSAYGLATGRGRPMAAALAGQWRRFTLTAVMSMVTYWLVLVAVRRAPVGYVAALRESSVLVAALMGWRYLDEGSIHRRMLAATIIVGGLVLLVASA